MRAALASLSRYIGTARVARHRLFVWLEYPTLPDRQIMVVAHDDDYLHGVRPYKTAKTARVMGASDGLMARRASGLRRQRWGLEIQPLQERSGHRELLDQATIPRLLIAIHLAIAMRLTECT
jgi:hypothetical protein